MGEPIVFKCAENLNLFNTFTHAGLFFVWCTVNLVQVALLSRKVICWWFGRFFQLFMQLSKMTCYCFVLVKVVAKSTAFETDTV